MFEERRKAPVQDIGIVSSSGMPSNARMGPSHKTIAKYRSAASCGRSIWALPAAVHRRNASASRATNCKCTSRSEEHTSELQSLMRISYAVFCLKKKKLYKRHITVLTQSQTTHD